MTDAQRTRPSPPAACVICGASPTIRAHLAPRALFHDMRAGHPKLYAGSVAKEAIDWPQSGPVDPALLCSAHEDQLGPLDDYAVDFIRSFRGRAIRGLQKRWLVSKVDGDRLLRFALSVVWRYSASKLDDANAVDLGAHEPVVRAAVFDGADVGAFGLWIDAWISDPDVYTQIYMAPYGDARAGLWRFSIRGLRFQVTLPGYRNRRVMPAATRLTGRRAATGHFVDLETSEEWNGVIDVGVQMRRAELRLKHRADQRHG